MPSIADMLIEKGRKKGLKEAYQEAYEEAYEEGCRKGYILVIVKLLEMKFHTVSESLQSQIMSVHDQATLGTIMERALSAETRSQFKDRVKDILPH